MKETLGFAVTELSRLIRRAFDDRARAIGVTRAQWHTLFMLSRNEGINQGGLADLLEVEPITLCRMVDRLADAGLVERRADPSDRRAWRIYLTDAARPLLERLRGLGESLNETALDGLSAEERDQLLSLLARVRANVTGNAHTREEALHG